MSSEEIDKLFFEVILAPSYGEEALEILKHKKNRIILIHKEDNKRKIVTKILDGREVEDSTILNELLNKYKEIK